MGDPMLLCDDANATFCAVGAGVGGVPHKFMYPKEDKENYQVTQFASQAAGSQGLAAYVQQISETAIKVGSNSCTYFCLPALHERPGQYSLEERCRPSAAHSASPSTICNETAGRALLCSHSLLLTAGPSVLNARLSLRSFQGDTILTCKCMACIGHCSTATSMLQGFEVADAQLQMPSELTAYNAAAMQSGVQYQAPLCSCESVVLLPGAGRFHIGAVWRLIAEGSWAARWGSRR